MFKTTSVATLYVMHSCIADWACSEKNGRFSRLYHCHISKYERGFDGIVDPDSFEVVIDDCECTWSEVLEFVRGQLLRAKLNREDATFFSDTGDYCGRIGREINAILPSHGHPVRSDGK